MKLRIPKAGGIKQVVGKRCNDDAFSFSFTAVVEFRFFGFSLRCDILRYSEVRLECILKSYVDFYLQNLKNEAD